MGINDGGSDGGHPRLRHPRDLAPAAARRAGMPALDALRACE
jgi:hypothetical protein